MKLNKKVLALIVLGGLSVSGNSMAATASAEALANTCAGCHGVEGNSTGPAIPSIAGIMSADNFKEVMLDYQNEDGRRNTIMTRIAKGYSEAEIQLMSDYFAKQKLVPVKQKFDATQAKAGKELHEKYCKKCHVDGGSSAEEDGILAGQWMSYLNYTMDDYLDEPSKMGKKMRKKVKKLQKADAKGLEKLMHYYASQQ